MISGSLRDRWGTRLLWAAVALLCLFLLRSLMQRRQVSGLPVAQARPGDLTLRLSFRGAVELGGGNGVAAPQLPEMHVTWCAPSGAQVKPGDVVVKLAAVEAEREAGQDALQLRQARARLAALELDGQIARLNAASSIADAQAGLAEAQVDVRTGSLLSRLEQQRFQAAAALAATQLAAQKSLAAQAREQDRLRLAAAQQDVKRLEARLADLRRQLARLVLRAPVAGRVGYDRWWGLSAGDPVASGEELFHVSRPGHLLFVATVPESERPYLHSAQPAAVDFDAWPGKSFSAHLQSIPPVATVAPGWPPQRNFEVAFQLPITEANAQPGLAPGMQGKVTVTVTTVPHAVLIPRAAVQWQAGKARVRVLDGLDLKTTAIQVLGMNENQAAVSGITAGQTVVLPAAEAK